MKKLLPLFFSSFLVINLNAQVKKRYNRPFIGVNFGVAWQQSDVRDIARTAGGFTFGKYYIQNEINLFDFGWRFRYLHGGTRGLDLKRNNNIKNNPVFNNNANPQLNYADSLGYVFNNYRMNFDEFAFELIMGLNKLREKTRIVLYAFGGAGFSGWQTKMNQLDVNQKMYAYDLLGPSPSLSEIKSFLDKTYETNADGNSKYGFHFVPSFGLGLGRQTKRGHYIGMEHRITCMLTDKADGVKQSGGGFLGKDNDFYHYSGIFIRWLIGGGTGTYHTSEPTGYNPPPPPLPTYTSSTVYNPPPPSSSPSPSNNKPSVIINYPTSEPFITSNGMITIMASVFNVGSKNDITVKVNGSPSQNFTYDGFTKVLSLTSMLSPGNNSFYILAVNPYGSEWKSINVIYEQGVIPHSQKPVITLISPSQNPFNTSSNTVTINATVFNVTSQNGIAVFVNNKPFSNFNYNASSKILSFTSALNEGNNNFLITASNANGSDSKELTVNYTKKIIPPRPVVNITVPSTSSHSVSQPNVSVTATVHNVNSKNEIMVKVNNTIFPDFSYSDDNKTVNFNVVALNPGSNIITVSASNQGGSDSKSVIVNYIKQVSSQLPKPVVAITFPSSNPFLSNSQLVNVAATVLNISGKNDISIKGPNGAITNFTYDHLKGTVSVPVTLGKGDNVITIAATNVSGSDSKSITLRFEPIIQPGVGAGVNPKGGGQKPVVTFINPSQTLSTVNSQILGVRATVQHVAKSSDIKVTVNGSDVSNFSFDTSSHMVTFNVTLGLGVLNNITITGTNSYGSDSKTVIVTVSQ